MPNGDLNTFKEAFIGAVLGAIGRGAPFSDNAPNATDSPNLGIINVPIFNSEPTPLPDPVPDPEPENDLVYPNPNSTGTSEPLPYDNEDEFPVEIDESVQGNPVSKEDIHDYTYETENKKLRIAPNTSVYFQFIKVPNGRSRWINTGIPVGCQNYSYYVALKKIR